MKVSEPRWSSHNSALSKFYKHTHTQTNNTHTHTHGPEKQQIKLHSPDTAGSRVYFQLADTIFTVFTHQLVGMNSGWIFISHQRNFNVGWSIITFNLQTRNKTFRIFSFLSFSFCCCCCHFVFVNTHTQEHAASSHTNTSTNSHAM